MISDYIAYWKMNEQSGNIIDQKGVYPGTPTGTTVVDGWRGNKVRRFNGTTDFIDVGDIQDVSAITISAWVKPSSLSASMNIVAKGDVSASRMAWRIHYQNISQGLLTFNIKNGAGEHEATESLGDPVSIFLDKWIHVVGLTDGTRSGSFIYVNAVDKTTLRSGTADFSILNNNDNAYIGSSLNGTDEWNGDIAEVSIFDRSLSDTEIHQLYLTGLNNLRLNNKGIRPRPFAPGLAR